MPSGIDLFIRGQLRRPVLRVGRLHGVFQLRVKQHPLVHLDDGVLVGACGWRDRIGLRRARFRCPRHPAPAGSGSTNNVCHPAVAPRSSPAISAVRSDRDCPSRNTGQLSATAGFIITFASHSVAEMIFGFSFQAFHGSVLSVCFSRIASSALRASESSGCTRPLAVTGSSPNSVKAKSLSVRRLQIAEKPRGHHGHQDGRKPFLKNLFHFVLRLEINPTRCIHELDHQPGADHRAADVRRQPAGIVHDLQHRGGRAARLCAVWPASIWYW